MSNYNTKNIINEYIIFHENKVKFPTLTKCSLCNGYTGFCHPKKSHPNHIKDKKIATYIAAIQHGFNICKWENKNVTNKNNFPYPCKCTCNHYWNSKTIGKCLHFLTCEKCNSKVTLDSSD